MVGGTFVYVTDILNASATVAKFAAYYLFLHLERKAYAPVEDKNV